MQNPFADLSPTLEACARCAARGMLGEIIESATSPDDALALVEQVIACMRDEWGTIDFERYAEDFGTFPFEECSG